MGAVPGEASETVVRENDAVSVHVSLCALAKRWYVCRMTIPVLALSLTLGCDRSGSDSLPEESDADTDTDADTDADTDTDTDSDADIDSWPDDECDTMGTVPIGKVDPTAWPTGTEEALAVLEALNGQWTVQADCNDPAHATFDLDLTAPAESVGLFPSYSPCGLGRAELTFDTSRFEMGGAEVEFDGVVGMRLMASNVLRAEYRVPLDTFVYEDWAKEHYGTIESQSAEQFFLLSADPDLDLSLGWTEEYDTVGDTVQVGGHCWSDDIDARKK